YLHPDHLGTPRSATNSNAQIVWRWDSDPFGKASPNEDPDGDATNATVNLRFPGQYADVESGLDYNYFRDYEPSMGRYVESDPIGLDGGINTYAYVKGNPVSSFDPRGLVIPASLVEPCEGPGCRGVSTFSPDAPRWPAAKAWDWNGNLQPGWKNQDYI